MTGFCDSRYDSLAASEIPTNMLFSALKYVRFFKYVQNLSMKQQYMNWALLTVEYYSMKMLHTTLAISITREYKCKYKSSLCSVWYI